MEIAGNILDIAQKIYSLCEQVKSNQRRIQRLRHRIEALMVPVQAIQKQGVDSSSRANILKALQELLETLENTRKYVEKYTSSERWKKFLRAGDTEEKCNSINERLNDAAQVLSLLLQVEQVEQLKSAFQESKEDAELDKDDVDETCSVYPIKDIREIRRDELAIETKPIMEGPNSKIYRGKYQKFTVAIKRFTNSSLEEREVRKIFRKEIETMKKFESPNILRVFGICIESLGSSPNFMIVMEYCELGCLRQVLDSKRELSWLQRIQMSLDATRGLYRLHQSEEKFKVHGCINSMRYLMDSGLRVKLGGFELARTETSLQQNKKGGMGNKTRSAPYTSPQQLHDINYPYDKPCEIYSFGIVLWEIATREIPFKGYRTSEIYEKVYKSQYRQALPDDCPSDLKELIDECRNFDPFERPTAGVIMDKLESVESNAPRDA
ncbi:mixed lineage kinase domain-like protein [Latimeria chalumnae]|uniref:Mixed lineage kinase domain like pseudokinase n=1 Tax=Latimeria chalumnae TaxID=7897 RepID=M3XKH0_LATCH|nr:PREDICTED: mixed lineage kinase domain-like protein [Latimeria chalumnae]|eukprot:XP_006010420.1 PREDICTED: mixed lineage kinase domain-like protein [Latimeria chalumnae]